MAEVNLVSLTIDNVNTRVPKGFTVLEAAKTVNVDIPTLCYLKGINEIGACRVCMVEVGESATLKAACVTPVEEGMVIKTNTQRIRSSRREVLKLTLASHNRECTTCIRSRSCELQTMAEDLGVEEINYPNRKTLREIDDRSDAIVRDNSKCILCGRCVNVCRDVQGVGVLDFTQRGIDTHVTTPFNLGLEDTPCISCGQCVTACPVGALKEKEEMERVWQALEDPNKHVVVQAAPAIRAALGEEFGLPMGTLVTGKMVSALKRLGFGKVFDTNFGADLTVLLEGQELLSRLQGNGPLPMITSCSPGWVNFCEFYYPEMLPHISSCKSPQSIVGALVKSEYAQKNNIDPKNIFTVSIMPCTAKKVEVKRAELAVDGNPDVDAVLTTRELAKMIKQAGLSFLKLPEEEFDADLGDFVGIGVIAGTTGGIMEATLRFTAAALGEDSISELEFHSVRGVDGIKETVVQMAGRQIAIAVAHGTGNAAKLMTMIKNGEKNYHFVEIMGCSGGCVAGGGQPHVSAHVRMKQDIRVERAKALYQEFAVKNAKRQDNPLVNRIMDPAIIARLEHLCHTHYHARKKFSLRSEE